ncbi:MAG: potassium channel family protein [Halobacteriota archaeon]
MAALPVELLYGLYLGILTGIVPALVAFGLGFIFKYVTGVTLPGLGVVVLGVAIAGVNGGLLALNDSTLTNSESRFRLTVALIVVLMLTLYAHSQGDKLGSTVPRRFSLRALTERTLSADVVELVGGRGQVRVTVTGDIADIEGFPAVPADLREAIRNDSWTFPADIPLVELEARVADRLRTDYDLEDVSVRLDERARATVAAAPPIGALSKRVPPRMRAVSISALVPTGLARGDEVTVTIDETACDGTVLSVTTSGDVPSVRTDAGVGGSTTPATDGGADAESPGATPRQVTPTAIGGECRVTLAVDRADAETLLGSSVDRLVVRSRGVRREFELVSLLRRAGNRFEEYVVGEDAPLADTTLGESNVRDVYGVVALAIRHGGHWTIAPRGSQQIVAGDELLVVGPRDALAQFREVVT